MTAEIARILGVRRIRRRPWPYASSLPMERVDLDDGTSVIFKDLSRAEDLRRPAFLVDRRREIMAYTDVLADLEVDAPRYRAAVVDDDRAWLFLELVDGIPLWQAQDMEAWQEAARCLAALHAARHPPIRGLLRYDAEHLSRCLALGGSIPGVAELSGCVAERLAKLPVGLVHGEFYPSNVLVQRTAGRLRIRPVDWEMIGTGPGVLDLAALTAGSWDVAERARVEQAYADACPAELRPAPGDLDCARLVLAAQMVGWSPAWTPPAEHRHDWVQIALRLIEQIAR